MPTFVDRHRLSAVPGPTLHRLHVEAVHGAPDPSGAQPLAQWVEDGYIYCVIEAPDDRAVCRHHLARELACDDLHPVSGLKGTRPLTGHETGAVRAAIIDIWHKVASD